MLDLHDFPGQGTALVGVLDPLWNEKGYVTAQQWRRFCSPIVPLARLERRVFTTADTLEVPIEIANYSRQALSNAVVRWQLTGDFGRLRIMVVARRDFDPQTFDPKAKLIDLMKDLTFIAMVGIVDPPRAEAKEAISKCHSAEPGAHDHRRPRRDGCSYRARAGH